MISKNIQIIKFKSSGDIKLTLEGTQLLQSIQGPLGIISIIGPPKSGKTNLCQKLLSSSFKSSPKNTKGIWAWPETLKVIKRDEDGTEYKLDLLIIDSEAIVSRVDSNKTRGLEILTLVSLLSSHLVFLTDQVLHTQNMLDLDIFAELPNLISVQKRVDSFKSLHEYLPALTWVVYGPDLKAPEEAAGIYFEKILSNQGSAESTKIKTAIRMFFRNRNCFSVVHENKGQLHRLVEFLQQKTPVKSIFNINLNGRVLAGMLQLFVSRLQKKSPVVIQSAFNRAVAAEARNIIEKLYVKYIEDMKEIESQLPCNEEDLWLHHHRNSAELLDHFEGSMIEFKECSEMSEEKKSVIQRITLFYEELKKANHTKSEEKCRKVYSEVFEQIFKDPEISEHLLESEEKILNGLQSFYELSAGPAAAKVFLEECSGLVRFLYACIKDVFNTAESARLGLEQEIEKLKKSRDRSRLNEQKMKEMFESSLKEYEEKVQEKERELNEFQINLNQKLSKSESKVRDLNRDLKSKKQEIDQLQAEKEAIIEMERSIFSQKEKEYEEVISKLKEKIKELEFEEQANNSKHQKTLSAKDIEIVKVKQTENFPENATESVQDFPLLSGLKRDIAEMFILIESEQINHSKFVNQLDKISTLQTELNKSKLKEIEDRNKLTEEYDEQISDLKDQLDNLTDELGHYKGLKNRNKEEERNEKEEELRNLINEIKLKTEQNKLLSQMIDKRDEEIESLYKVIETHKKQFEDLDINTEDKATELHKLRLEIFQLRDDIDVIIGLMSYSLEVSQKKRNIQTINLSQVQEESNRSKVAKIFKKFGIPFEE